MADRKIKVAMITNHFGITGIGTVMMNYCLALDKEKYDLTIIAGTPIAEKYEQECQAAGIQLIALPARHGEPLQHYIAMWKALKKGHYDIVHDHGSSSMMAIELTLAKLAGVKKRIAHSHNSTCTNTRIQRLLNPYFRTIYTCALACGTSAGNWLFGENGFEVLPNAFHVEEFLFSKDDRMSIRRKLSIEGQIVIGHIGRINTQKNQQYLLKVFEKIASVRDDVVLLLVGTGPDEEKIKKQVESHIHRDRIIMYGETDNASAMYSAMDIFAFPSKFEGLPVVLLEAQISGLPCVVSDKVTREVDLGDIKWLSIDVEPEEWANTIAATPRRQDEERLVYRKKHMEKLKKYDIEQSVKQLEGIYEELLGVDGSGGR